MRLHEYAKRRIKEDPTSEATVRRLEAYWRTQSEIRPEIYPPNWGAEYEDWLDQEEAYQGDDIYDVAMTPEQATLAARLLRPLSPIPVRAVGATVVFSDSDGDYQPMRTVDEVEGFARAIAREDK